MTNPTPDQLIMTMLGALGLTLTSAPIQGRPRFLGATADKRLALELLGPLTQLQGITVLARVDPSDLEAARRNGELMGYFLDLVAPTWRGRIAWLAEGFKRFDRVRHRLEKDPQRYKALPWRVQLPYANLTLTFLHKTNQVALKIAMRGAYVAIAAA